MMSTADALPELSEETLALRKANKRRNKLDKLSAIKKQKNLPHVTYLKHMLKQILPEVERLEAEENEAYTSGAAMRVSQKGFAELMQSNSADGAKFIPHRDICGALAQDNSRALLDYDMLSERMAICSNRETATLKAAIDGLDEGSLDGVPFDGGTFHLVPEQRLWIGMHNKSVSQDIYCKVKDKDDPHSEVELVRPAGTLSDINFDNVTPGSGKTAMALIKALKTCVPDAAWEQAEQMWKDSNSEGKGINGLGLVQKRSCDTRTLARVVVVLVPEPLLGQWKDHAQKLQVVFKEDCRKGFEIWTGLNVLVRDTTTREGIAKNMAEAQKITIQKNRALLWILVAEPNATKATTLYDPSIAYVARIYDEVAGTRSTEPRYRQKRESEVMFTSVENATVKLLSDATATQATHPIRRAFGGEKISFQSPTHMAIMWHASAPKWARDLLARGMQPVMPSGVHITNFKIRTESLAATMHGISDLQITTVDHLLDHTIAGLGLPASTKAYGDEIKGRAKAILMANGASAQGSIAQMLKAAAADAAAKVAAMPVPITATIAVQAMTAAQRGTNDALAVRHKCMIGTKRLFQQLYEAVDPNPGEPRFCPITFLDTEPENVVILACCVNWISRIALGGIMGNPNPDQHKCPYCNKLIGNHAVDDELVQSLLAPLVNGAAQAPAPEPEPEPEPVIVTAGDDASLFAKLETLRDASFKAGPLAAIEIIKNVLAWKGGKAMRLLLTFNYNLNTSGSSLTDKVRALMLESCPGLTSVDAVAENDGGGSALAITNYQNADDANRILIINTTRGSNSLAGLNLGGTDVVLFDRTSSTQSPWGSTALSGEQMTQAIARALRPQPFKPAADTAPNPYTVCDDDGVFAPPKSTHAAKLVIFLDSA